MYPEIGQWYLNDETMQQFEVVATDMEGDAIQIQYFEGEIDELDYESWYSLPLSIMAPPEDWSGPFETDDDHYDDTEDYDYNDVGGRRHEHSDY